MITCLYGKPKANLREIIRSGNARQEVAKKILEAFGSSAKTGFGVQQEHQKVFDNAMTSIEG